MNYYFCLLLHYSRCQMKVSDYGRKGQTHSANIYFTYGAQPETTALPRILLLVLSSAPKWNDGQKERKQCEQIKKKTNSESCSYACKKNRAWHLSRHPPSDNLTARGLTTKLEAGLC